MVGAGVILCLVTDRRQLSPEARTAHDEVLALATWLERAVAAGIDMIQVRERDLPPRLLCELARAVVATAAGSATRVLINDRADVAVAARADGVHLRGDGPPVADVRRLDPRAGPGWVVGRSVHAAEEARAHADADYLVFGSVFASGPKPSQGLDALRSVVTACAGTPVVAVGGVTVERAAACVAAGASGVAAIRVFLPPGRAEGAMGVEAGTAALRHAVDAGVAGRLSRSALDAT